MAEGRRRHDWDQTALVVSEVHNQWLKRGQRKRPEYFHPFKPRQRKPKPVMGPITALQRLMRPEDRAKLPKEALANGQ